MIIVGVFRQSHGKRTAIAVRLGRPKVQKVSTRDGIMDAGAKVGTKIDDGLAKLGWRVVWASWWAQL